MGVEDGPEKDTAEECEEDVDAKDPANVSFTVVSQGYGAGVGLEGADTVHQSKTCHEPRPRAHNDAPRAQSTFRVVARVSKVPPQARFDRLQGRRASEIA